jgi:uncharacterized protein (TIGR04255 family)
MPGTYARNNLEAVIFRLDFKDTEINSLKSYYEHIKGLLSLQDEKRAVRGDFTFDVAAGTMKDQSVQTILWVFKNPENTKSLEIGIDHFAYTVTKYIDYSHFKDDINVLLGPFMSAAKITTIQRMGLRYVNRIKLDESKPLEWTKYINNDLIGSLKFIRENSLRIARAMNQLVVKGSNADVIVNYGLWNQDYPNELTRKDFVLDLDCASRLPFDVNESPILDLLTEYNGQLTSLFELSIEDGLRSKMGGE